MVSPKKILFITGTRADFGKIKSILKNLIAARHHEVYLFVTGMHLHAKYGMTINEIVREDITHVFPFINSTSETTMDLTLAKTIEGLSSFVHEARPDLIVVHGDRVETLAGAIVGSLNNIQVAHVEGGELSGTIDDIIRHAVSKLSHSHFVSNRRAALRLQQLGELCSSIYEIGSPDVDLMFNKDLPTIDKVKDRYGINFSDYGIVLFHPVTTEPEQNRIHARNLVDALLADNGNYVVVYPNNDLGSGFILSEYNRIKDIQRFKIFPSIRFEYFLILLKNCRFIIGNSSAGIREAPYYGVRTINVGSRQTSRSDFKELIHCPNEVSAITDAIARARLAGNYLPQHLFGNGQSAQKFFELLGTDQFWMVEKQKQFCDLPGLVEQSNRSVSS